MHGHAFRARSAENVVAEFEYIAANFPDVKEVVIEDDTFTANKKRVLDICRLLIEKKLYKRLNGYVTHVSIWTWKLCAP